MKKTFFIVLSIILCSSFLLVACQNNKTDSNESEKVVQEHHPNEGKLLLTSELKEEIEDYIKKRSFSDVTTDLEILLSASGLTFAKGYHLDHIKNVDVKIMDHEPYDDYHYIVYAICKIYDKYTDIAEFKTKFMLYFEENDETKEKQIKTDYTQFYANLRKLISSM